MISIGYIFGTSVTVLAVIACLVFFKIGRRASARLVKESEEETGLTHKHLQSEANAARWLSRSALALSGAIVAFWVWVTWPSFDMEYHSYTSVAGVVETVEKRMVTEDKGMSEKFVVRLEDGQEYGCVDTRCALVKPEGYVELTCIKVWMWYGADAYDCDYVAFKENS